MRLQKAREQELDYMKKKNELEILKLKQLSDVEVQKITSIIDSLGTDTIKGIATAGQDLQVIIQIFVYFI